MMSRIQPGQNDNAKASTQHEPDVSRIIIIGVGVFGLSLLRHIVSIKPSADVIAYDSNEKGSAMKDIYKIIRSLYASPQRTKDASKAEKAWTIDEPLSKFCHRIGRAEITNDRETLEAIDKIKPRKRITEQSIRKYLETPGLSPNERNCLEFIADLLKTANDPTLQCVWNEDNAVVDWDPCIRRIREQLDTKIREAKVRKLILGDEGRVCALQLEDAETITVDDGDCVIMTTGAWGESLLKASGIPSPPKGLRAVGVFTFHLGLNSDHLEYLRGKPALSFQDSSITCEFLPPLSKNVLAKIGLTLPFTNEQNEPQDEPESYLMYHAMLLVRNWVSKYYPKLIGAEIITKEMHWDGVTEDQTPLISWHPEYKNLGIAWGGSFTRAKDFPTIGEVIFGILFSGNSSEEFGWNSKPLKDRVQHNQPRLLTNDTFQTMNSEAKLNEEVRAYKENGPPYYI